MKYFSDKMAKKMNELLENLGGVSTDFFLHLCHLIRRGFAHQVVKYLFY